MSSELIKAELTEGYTSEQIELIKNTVAKGSTDMELKLFLHVANAHGLDPFTKQIHFIKRRTWNKSKNAYDEVGTIQTGIDGYRVVASRTGQLAGADDAQYDSETEAHPKKATVTVYRMIAGQRCAFTATARWDEYVQSYNDKPSGLWAKMPYLMLAKCAEALALRKAFPAELSGIYTHEEMQQAEKAEAVHAEAAEPKYVSDDSETKKLLIFTLLKALKADVSSKESSVASVKELAKLDLDEKNYDEIIERLNVLKNERI